MKDSFQHEDKKLYGIATVGTKGQIVIPADAREEMGLKPGDKLYIAGSPSKKILICLGEEQLREMISKLTGTLDAVNGLIDKSNKNEG